MNVSSAGAVGAVYTPPAAKVAPAPAPPAPAPARAADRDGDGDSDKGGVDIRV